MSPSAYLQHLVTHTADTAAINPRALVVHDVCANILAHTGRDDAAIVAEIDRRFSVWTSAIQVYAAKNMPVHAQGARDLLVHFVRVLDAHTPRLDNVPTFLPH